MLIILIINVSAIILFNLLIEIVEFSKNFKDSKLMRGFCFEFAKKGLISIISKT